MAHQVIWSASATSELNDIAEHIGADSEFHAQSFVWQALGLSRSLEMFPLQGHVVEELKYPSVREVPVRGYRLIYQVLPRRVEIIAFIHGARELPDLSDRLKRE
jgi:toxin ParE1/3/4